MTHPSSADVASTSPLAAPPLVTPAPLWLRFWRHPVTTMVWRLVAFVGLMFVLTMAVGKLLPLPRLTPEAAIVATGTDMWLRALRSILPAALAYWLLVRFIERRKVDELAIRKALPHSAAGWLVGMAIMLLAAGAMALVGAFRVEGMNAGVNLLAPLLVLGIVPGIVEEIIVRGIVFRVVEDSLGTWIALGLSAALFGFGHYANPNATAWSSIAIAIEAGLLLGMAYAWTRSLWFCFGLHAAWNFTQGPLLGVPVSGFELRGLLQSSAHGPEILSGGRFGAEASILAVIICVSVAAYFTRRAVAEGLIKAPFWRRRAVVVAPKAVAVP